MPQDELLEERDVRREVALAALAVVSILIGFSRFSDPGALVPTWVKALDVAIALAFFANWLARVRRAPEPKRYALRYAFEAVTWIPFTVFATPALAGADVLRGARFIRFARVLRYAGAAKLGLGLARVPRRLRYLQRVAGAAQLATILVVGLLVIAGGAAALLWFERSATTVTGYGGAFWWSLSLFTTLAYDVPTPSTTGGRFAAGAVMVLGVVYVGVLTASVASALLSTPGPDED